MSYESSAEPIKFGYLFDFLLPDPKDGHSREKANDRINSFEMVFKEGFEKGVIDRPVEILLKEVEGLPKGTIKAVIDGYAELVEQGCLVVFGPAISDNCEPIREVIEQRFKVPAISVTGSEEWLGEWTFSLPMGSLTEEPIVWAHLIAKRGLKTVGALIEKSVCGQSYIQNFRKACRDHGLTIVGEEMIPQTAADDVSAQVRRLYDAKPDALVHCGFGFAVIPINPALEALNWDPPRFMGTAFENAWIRPQIWKAVLGWIGLDQYDEGNVLGQQTLDQYEKLYGRRPENYLVPINRDLATVLLHALADAHPLTPRGVRDALERVKLVPAASGSPGTRISFGKWLHRGWVGPGYLVPRRLDPDGVTSHLVERFGQD
jgi:branched-chain amino acid transport system substrate-binding protein